MNNDTGEGLRSLFYLGVGSDRQSGTTPTDWQAYATANEAPSQTVNIADNTANEWLITGIQLEVGEQATPFEHRSFADELIRCRRYFTIVCGNDDNTFTITHAWTSQEVIGHLDLGNIELKNNCHDVEIRQHAFHDSFWRNYRNFRQREFCTDQ